MLEDGFAIVCLDGEVSVIVFDKNSCDVIDTTKVSSFESRGNAGRCYLHHITPHFCKDHRTSRHCSRLHHFSCVKKARVHMYVVTSFPNLSTRLRIY